MDYAIGGIGVAILIVGIVQAAKDFGLTSRRGKQALALGTGIVLVGVSHGISEGLVSDVYVPYITWIVTTLTGDLGQLTDADLLQGDLEHGAASYQLLLGPVVILV